MKTEIKNRVINTLRDLLAKNMLQIISENERDSECLKLQDPTLRERLKTDETKVKSMINSLKEIAKQEDPEGRVIYSFEKSNGLVIKNKTVPFGTILIIYESRPDVTVEAAAIAFKAGNRVLLKGGSESRKTNIYLANLWREALILNGVDPDFVEYLDYDREQTKELISGKGRKIDLIIPRGGDGLIDFVQNNSCLPVIVSGRGNNFLYTDKDCDFPMAVEVILNGKSKVSVCNALDKVLINRNMPDLKERLELLVTSLEKAGVEVTGSNEIAAMDNRVRTNDNYTVLGREFLAPEIYIMTVESVIEAIELINRYSGGHSASIITGNNEIAEDFMLKVDCAAVYHNASVRFTDGGEFGLGAEIGIGTGKLHSRGPLGTSSLVTNKWFIEGNGQIR
jgi:glutamate-5-semialdehyde dehydrogenase